MGHLRARCKLGFDLNTQVHHCRDKPGIVGGCHLSRDLNRPALITQSPEQGGGCRCLPNLLDRLWFSLHQTLALPSTTNRVAIVLSLSASFPWPASLPPRSAPTSHNAAARTLLHSPRAGAVELPVSGPPLPPLSSSHSSRHARRAAAHTVVSPCPVRTAPRYTARFPPAACAPSYLRLC